MATIDYYVELGVGKGATTAEIRDAFKALARRYHPDRNPDDVQNLEKFQRVTIAYETLSDPEKRELYDRLGPLYQLEKSPPSPDELGRFVSDAIGGLFRSHPRYRVGSDIETSIHIELSDILGTTKTFSILRQVVCSHCDGSGAKTEADIQTCTECDGKGKRSRLFRSPCSRCDGRGYTLINRCRNCGGIGREEKSDTLSINIPEGVQQGQILRVKGKGNSSLGKKENGDLLLTVQIQPHPILERRGKDLYCEVPLLIHEAIEGTLLSVPTLEGTTKIRIPAGTQTHQLFRLTGRGAPNTSSTTPSNTDGRGDLHIRVILETPHFLTPRQAELLNAFKLEASPTQTPSRRDFDEWIQSK